MANPVNNSGINAKVSVGGALNVDVKAGGTARVSDNQSQGIFENVNENYTKNPNHARAAGHAEDGDQTPRSTAKRADTPPAPNEDFANDPPPARNKAVTNKQSPHIGEDGTLNGIPQRGEDGGTIPTEPGRGPHKIGGQGQGQTQTQTPIPQGPPILVLPTDNPGDQQTGTTQNTPPIIFMPNRHDNGNHNGQYKNVPVFTTPNTSWQNTPANNYPSMGVNYSVDLNLRANGNQPFGVIRQVVNQVLRQNDIYLSNNTLNRLINHQTFQNSTRGLAQTQVNLPRDVNNFIQIIGKQVFSMLDNSHQNHKLIHRISKEIAHQLRENVQTVRHEILKNSDLGALHFKHLNMKEKMHVAVELLPAHLPPKALEHLQHHKAHEVLNGLLLTRGLLVPNERPAEVRNLVAFKSSVLPSEVSMTALRDVGQIVKTLISDTAAAKTTANLDLAVQKFVKILLANNELGVLLATINLAAQSPNQSGLVGRSLALAQIYELINQLIQAGEKALKDAAPDKNALQKDRNIFQAVGLTTLEDLDESKIQLNKTHANEAAGSLRQFLEFNPALVYDKSTSAYHNPDDARQAQKDFINLYHDDIAEWLESGKHRFVKDFDFDKPVGVVVERASEQIFTANTARFVLVRDGSVQGWHFLKSFLVK
jgi:hypothetical protein